MTVADTIICSSVTTVTLYGFAAVANVSGLESVFRVTGSRAVNRFATFFQTIEAAVAAELYDGYNYNCEANSSFNCFSSGGPGLQVGLSTHNTAKSDYTDLVQSYGRGDLEWNQLCGAGRTRRDYLLGGLQSHLRELLLAGRYGHRSELVSIHLSDGHGPIYRGRMAGKRPDFGERGGRSCLCVQRCGRDDGILRVHGWDLPT